MRYSSSGSEPASAKTKLLIALICIVLSVVALFALSQANNSKSDLDSGREQIKLVKVDGKTVLTDELLRSDYAVYAKTTATNLKIMVGIMGVMIVALLAIFIVFIIKTIHSVNNGDGNTAANLIRVIFSGLALTGVVVILCINGKSLLNSKPESADTADLRIVECYVIKKDSETIRTGTRKHKTTRTNYYVYLDNGQKLTVNSLVYSQVIGSGTYYIGMNDNDNIFSMYPASEYIPEGAESTAEGKAA